LSERLHPAPADPRRDDPAWAAGLARPRSRSTATQSKALTASFRREAFAANANAAASAQAQKRSYIRRVIVVDVLAVAVAVMLGYLARFQGERPGTNVPYVPVGIGLIGLWGLVLVWNRCYDDRILGYGADEYRRVVGGSLKLAGAVAIVSYLADFQVSRGFLGFAFVIGTALLPTCRWIMRRALHRSRYRERGWSRRVLVVGDASHVLELAHQLRREWYAGYRVVGACIPDALIAPVPQHLDGVPVVGSFRNILEAAAAVSADTVAITGSTELTGKRLRRLGWQMEGTGIDLVLAPSLTDVAGPRIHTRPIAGLPLIHVESPDFSGARKWVKGLFDRSAAGLGLLLLSPVFLLLALLIKIDSRGPVFFKQKRVGLGGTEFDVMKFRSMVVNAEAMVSELPQLINVVRGEMSLVGPRPPLPTEVAWYDQDVARRLLVKPGMTGLWQVSGRSDLSWEESIRLDLYYVENWSLAADLTILWKTLGAVVGSRGAY
jgi:lipopolysaccharide/colanic/teichoic acid biosynthesis glycosyltransferase